MQIQSIKYGDVAQTNLQVTLTDGLVMSTPWPCPTWHNQVILDWLALGNSITNAFSTQEFEDQMKETKIQELKQEGLSRIQATMPAISSFDTLELVREIWLSIAPAARNTTPNLQQIIDTYEAARDGIIFLKTASAAQVTAYDVVNTPTWPT